MRKFLTLMPLLVCLLIVNIVEAQTLSVDVSVVPQKLYPGDDGFIKVTLTNKGTQTIKSLKVGVVEVESPIYVKGICSTCVVWSEMAKKCVEYDKGCFEKIGELAPLDSQSIDYKFEVPKDAEEGKYYFKVDVYYEVGGESYEIFRTGVIEVTRNKGYVISLEFNQTDVLYSDSTSDLELRLINKGDKVEDLRVVFNSTQFISIVGSNGYYLGELLPNESRKLKFKVYVNPEVSSGIYTIPVILTYFDEDRTQQFTDVKLLGVEASSRPEIDFYISEIEPTKISSFSNFEVELKIFNRGVSTAKYIVARAESPVIEIENPEEYVGNLESDDFDLVKFRFRVGNLTGKVPINFTITYQLGMGKTESISKTFEVEISGVEKAEKINEFLLYGLAALAIVVILFLWVASRFRKGRRK
ncbi:hypothetical protein DRN63_03440 [Nanoarchaeota archaeon]|nr:MAG: hypothetical protein DRN63_03440 [Nanoarchaeota archaeon]